MRRPFLLLTVTVCVFGSLFLFLTLLAESAAAASVPEAAASAPEKPPSLMSLSETPRAPAAA